MTISRDIKCHQLQTEAITPDLELPKPGDLPVTDNWEDVSSPSPS